MHWNMCGMSSINVPHPLGQAAMGQFPLSFIVEPVGIYQDVKHIDHLWRWWVELFEALLRVFQSMRCRFFLLRVPICSIFLMFAFQRSLIWCVFWFLSRFTPLEVGVIWLWLGEWGSWLSGTTFTLLGGEICGWCLYYPGPMSIFFFCGVASYVQGGPHVQWDQVIVLV